MLMRMIICSDLWMPRGRSAKPAHRRTEDRADGVEGKDLADGMSTVFYTDYGFSLPRESTPMKKAE